MSRSRADFDSPLRLSSNNAKLIENQDSLRFDRRRPDKLEDFERSLFSQELPQKPSLTEVSVLVEQIESKMADYHAMVESLASTMESVQLNLSNLSRLNQQTTNCTQCICKTVKASFNNLLNHTSEYSKSEVVEMLATKLQEIVLQKQQTSILDPDIDEDEEKLMQKAAEMSDSNLLEEHKSESTPTHSKLLKVDEIADPKGPDEIVGEIHGSEESSDHSFGAHLKRKPLLGLPQYRPLIPAEFIKSNDEIITLTTKSKKANTHQSDKVIRRKNDDSLGDTAPPESPDRSKRKAFLHRMQSSGHRKPQLDDEPEFPAPILEERKLSLFCPEALRHPNEIGRDLVEADARHADQNGGKQTSSKKAILKKPSLSKKKSEEENNKPSFSTPEGKKQARFADRSNFK